MFNIGFSELIVILLVAFIIVGPKDLPKVARTLGRWVRMAKQMYSDFKSEMGLDETADELMDVKRDMDKPFARPIPALNCARSSAIRKKPFGKPNRRPASKSPRLTVESTGDMIHKEETRCVLVLRKFC